MARAFILILLLGATITPAAAQDPNAVTQRDIDAAIRKGGEHLKVAASGADWLHPNCDELILLAMIAAGVPESNPKFDEYLRHCLQAPLEKTYKVALLAMVLEELDASGYQMKIAQCAAFLLDNQAANGQWLYGKPVDLKSYPLRRAREEDRDRRQARGPRIRAGRPRAQEAVEVDRRPPDQARRRGGATTRTPSTPRWGCAPASTRTSSCPPMPCTSPASGGVESQYPDESDGAKAGKNAVTRAARAPRSRAGATRSPATRGRRIPPMRCPPAPSARP